MKFKKLIAVFLAAAMVCGTCACGSSVEGTEKDVGTAASESTDTGSSAVAGESEGFPLAEPVTISVFAIQLSSVVDLEQNTVFQELEEYTNVNLDLTLVPYDGASEKLNLMLASGEYPDIIMGCYLLSNQDLEKYGTEEQILIPLNDLIEEYGIHIKERWAEHPNWKDEMTSSDGSIYGIPTADSGGEGHSDCSYKMWINTEWLDAVGMDMPQTTDEFRDVLMAFKNDDPNGNGIMDEIPLTGATNTWSADPYLFLLNAFGYFDTNYYYLKDGVVNSILDKDYVKEGLKYVHDLYENGLIDPAAFTQDESQMSAVGNNADTIIAGAATCGHVGMFLDINNSERYSQYEIMMPLEGTDGYIGIPYRKSASVNGASFVITDKCQNPEIAIQIADLFCDEEWSVRALVGKQSDSWDLADEGTYGMDGVTPAKYKYLLFNTMVDANQSVDKWDNTLRLLEPNWKNLFAVEGDIMDATNYEARLYADTVKLKAYAADADTIPPLTYAGDDSTTFSQLSTAIKDYASNAIVEFITGTRDIDNGWDSYLADLNRLGYQDMIELVQKTYDAR